MGCLWNVHLGSGRTCQVEYRFGTMDILVDDIKAAVEGQFMEEEEEEGSGVPSVSGVRYRLQLGPSLLEALLTVIPSETGRGPPECVLVVNGVIIQSKPAR